MSATLISRLAVLLLVSAVLFINGTDCQRPRFREPENPRFSTFPAVPSPVELPPSRAELVPSSTSLAQPVSFRQIMVDAFKQLLAAPMRLMKVLVQEVNQFIKNRDLRDMFDLKVLKQLFSKAPKRLFAYYEALAGLESRCLKRTICDLAEFSSRRLPKWLEQIAFIYFNTFAQTKPYYEVIVHGITVKNCAMMYSECDPEEFIARLRSNITSTIVTTVAPFRTALNELDAQLDDSQLDDSEE